MSLEKRIMQQLPDEPMNQCEEFFDGFSLASIKAATIAAEADELMEEMECLLESASMGLVIIDRAKDVLDKLDNWKDQTK